MSDDDGEVPKYVRDYPTGPLVKNPVWTDNDGEDGTNEEIWLNGSWQPSHPTDKEIWKKYIKRATDVATGFRPSTSIETKGKTPLHARIMAIGETRIQVLEDKAYDALLQPGVEYGKILTAIKEVKIYLDLIRELKV